MRYIISKMIRIVVRDISPPKKLVITNRNSMINPIINETLSLISINLITPI